MTAGAELALLGGSVYTMDPERPRADACAIGAGRILAVGSEAEVREVCDAATEIVDLRGGMVVPGFQDAHVHPPMGGVERLRCDLTRGRSRADYLATIAAYAAANPDLDWIRGGGWSMPAFPGGVPVASDLDEATGGRAVFLPNRDHHSAWVSTKALELAGVTAETPDPFDGRIERDASGRPTGALHDGAMNFVERLLPPLTTDDYVEGLLEAQRYLHSLGITAWQDAWVSAAPGQNSFDAYLRLAADGRLTARVVTAHWWEREQGPEQVEGFVAAREAAAGLDRLRAGTVKIMQDGVCETFTAAMLTPYLDVHGHETGHCGNSFVEPEALKEHVRLLDSKGFQVHIHAIGDRAVREALDAVEVARNANGDSRLRHHIAHLQVVHPDDLGRFAPLGVSANFQPLWACTDDQMVELTIPFLGPERSALQYPIGSLLSRGAHLAFGSDWPVSSPNPLAEMHVAVNRQAPADTRLGSSDRVEDPFLPEERIGLGEALRAFTLGSAFVNNLEDETGTVEVGKLADLALIDRDLFSSDEKDGAIADARVTMTLVAGEVVYESAG